MTKLTTSPKEAAEFVKAGGVCAFPTETVYGLGANVFDEPAIAKIFAAKQRPNDNPLIAHVASIKQIELLTKTITPSAEKFIRAFFPAALTLVLPKSAKVPLVATAGLETVGVRMPNHEIALTFLKECETPLVAPSANLSGKPSPTTWEAVYEDLNEQIDCILKGEQTILGLESTVVDCTGDAPVVLRSGAVTIEQLQTVVPETQILQGDSERQKRSPGLRHKHYAPRARVVLVNSPREISASLDAAFIGLDETAANFKLKKICQNVAEYAHSLFAFFRDADRVGIAVIYCQTVAEFDLGRALMDRLRRACR
jgi:L-threonylcarbamoyladenylate synthase